MTRVILALLLVCQPFCPPAAEVGFAEPGLFASAEAGQSKVVIVHDAAATHALSARADTVAAMVARGIKALTGQPTPAEAWRSLVTPEDVVGVKVHSIPGSASGTRPAVAAAVIQGLLEAGHPAGRILLWDRRLSDLHASGFDEVASRLGVRLAGALDCGYDPEVAYENPLLGQPVFGDLEFGQATNGVVTGRKSFLTRLVTREITRHIHLAPLLNHNHAGVSGILYTVASACTDNFIRFENNPSLLAAAVPEIYGQTNIADRVAINIVDALIGQYEGAHRSLLHYSATLNELRFSTDPVALDVLSLDALNRIRTTAGVPAVTNRFELYANARLLELGTDDFRRMEIIRLE